MGADCTSAVGVLGRAQLTSFEVDSPEPLRDTNVDRALSTRQMMYAYPPFPGARQRVSLDGAHDSHPPFIGRAAVFGDGPDPPTPSNGS